MPKTRLSTSGRGFGDGPAAKISSSGKAKNTTAPLAPAEAPPACRRSRRLRSSDSRGDAGQGGGDFLSPNGLTAARGLGPYESPADDAGVHSGGEVGEEDVDEMDIFAEDGEAGSSASAKQVIMSPVDSKRQKASAAVLMIVPFHYVLGFLQISHWACARMSCKHWYLRLRRSTGVLNHILTSLHLPLKPESRQLSRLIAAERVGRRSFELPNPMPLDLVTPIPSADPMLNGGTGIWTLEVHVQSGLLFAGCWGSGSDNIKCWDVTTGDFIGSLHGHSKDVRGLKCVGPTLYSCSDDGTARSWNIASMEARLTFCSPFDDRKPIQAIEANDKMVFTAEETKVRAYHNDSTASAWAEPHNHPGVVTDIVLQGDTIITGCTCTCFNGSGHTIRILDMRTGKYLRRLENEDWAERRTISFLFAVSSCEVMAGWAGCLGTPARGARPCEQEVACTIEYKAQNVRFKKRSLMAPAWGLLCFTFHAGRLIGGADNGNLIVWNVDGSERLRTVDINPLCGMEPNSLKIKAVKIYGSKLFVASELHGMFEGRLDSFDLASDIFS